MRRSSVVPWWGRMLPWVCAIAAVLAFSWALDIGGWKLFAFAVGLSTWLIGYRVSEINREASR